MFKNREIKVQMVKTPKSPTEPKESRTPLSVEQIHTISINTIERLAFLAAAGYASKRVLDTVSEITLIAARAKIK